jgi:hypothetical protein
MRISISAGGGFGEFAEEFVNDLVCNIYLGKGSKVLLEVRIWKHQVHSSRI